MKKPLLLASLLLPALAHCALAAPPGSAAPQNIGIQGALPDFKRVDIQSPHVYDYTFASAPTDWRTQSGIWEMTNRWPCAPGWSWFGGKSDEVAAIWNKRKFSGDISVQFYFGFLMGVAGIGEGKPAGWWNQTRLWEYPADAAITIGGDGKNLNSGYSLIIGADENRHTILKRRDKIVAESAAPEALLPSFADGSPDGAPGQFDTVHRRWWYVRIDKIGERVSCYLDNRLLFSYDDPKPLDAGQIALWTYNNGISLSRVQVYYDREIRPVYVRSTAQKTSQPQLAKQPSGTPKYAGISR